MGREKPPTDSQAWTCRGEEAEIKEEEKKGAVKKQVRMEKE